MLTLSHGAGAPTSDLTSAGLRRSCDNNRSKVHNTAVHSAHSETLLSQPVETLTSTKPVTGAKRRPDPATGLGGAG